MRGLGTLFNVIGIIAGGIVGNFVGHRLKSKMQETLLTMTGIGVVILGIGGALSQMLSVVDGKLTSSGSMMMIISLAGGAVMGELLQIENKVFQFGDWLKRISHSGEDNRFVSGFVSASCTVCIGAMAVIGSIQDGVSGDYSVLVAKGVIDAIIIFVMTAAQGKGSIFSAVPVGLFQGIITLLAFFAGDFLPAQAISNLSFVGSILILCVGLNLVRDKQIRVANTLPAVVIAVVFGYFQ
ncbi:DUF554 domain-containing protein [Proteiniclasticum sp. QWL-01]|uniref:DUF554 domain-containing protein n=1 Tax=Proteiniclasticum sp. QWL-01 TaxID=3036945 RepID=UPI00240FF2A6|nr:DUF554 domain-containing protein [Proteiniclasticum sp. QWL-01]WFF71764.1 DUF554 domain-containing protein [Proteiniclasticum sp. QWL-01]